MSKAKRIRIIKKAEREKMIESGINFVTDLDNQADFYILNIPGVGRINVTSSVKKRRLAI